MARVLDINSKIGVTIQRLRKEKGLTQEALSAEAEVDRKYLSDIENGKRQLSILIVERICNYFEMSLSDFFRRVEDIEKQKDEDRICRSQNHFECFTA